MITITDLQGSIQRYRLLYETDGIWKEICSGDKADKVKVHRFDRVWGNKVKIEIESTRGQASIVEFGVYDEQR